MVRWLDEVLQADRFVSSGDLAQATSSQSPLDPSLLGELGKLPGVEAAVGFRYQQPEYNGTIVFLIALDAASYAEHTAARSGKKRAALETLASSATSDSVVVSSNFALKHNVKVGDVLTLPSATGPVELRIAATAEDYSWSRGTVFIDRAVYARLFQDPLLDLMHVYLTDPAPDSEGSKSPQKLPPEIRASRAGPPQRAQVPRRTDRARVFTGLPATISHRRGRGARRRDGTS